MEFYKYYTSLIYYTVSTPAETHTTKIHHVQSFVQIYSSSQQMKHDNMTLNSEININILIGQSEDYPNNKYERGKASLIIGMIFIKKL